MKMKIVSLLAGVSVPLFLAGSASGEFVGLKTAKKFVDPADIAADTNIPGVTSLLVVNVYAEFTPGDAAARVIGAGGSAGAGIPLQINTRDGTFFQHPFGRASQLSPSAALAVLPGFNALKYDSFVTIGRKLDDDPIHGADLTNIMGGALDWTETLLTGVEVDWDVVGVAPQGAAGQAPDNPPDQVLIGQFTVANPGPNGGVFGTMLIGVVHTRGGGTVGQDLFQVFFDNQVPAPGTLALLGVAGLMGSRRRRR